MSITVDSIKSRIAEYEEELVKVVAQHGTLMGGLNELKQLLTIASDVAEAVAPGACSALDVISESIEAVQSVLDPEQASETPE